MNKQEAMKRLEAMQTEMDKLKAIIQKPDEPEIFQGRYLREGLGDEHWWVSAEESVENTGTSSDSTVNLGVCFATEEAAKQHLQYLKLMQQARIAMAKSWGDEEVDWCNDVQHKYALYIHRGKLDMFLSRVTYEKLHFRTIEDLDNFRDYFTDEEIKLMILGG